MQQARVGGTGGHADPRDPGGLRLSPELDPVRVLDAMKVGQAVRWHAGPNVSVMVSRWQNDFTITKAAGGREVTEEVRFHPADCASLVVHDVWRRVVAHCREEIGLLAPLNLTFDQDAFLTTRFHSFLETSYVHVGFHINSMSLEVASSLLEVPLPEVEKSAAILLEMGVIERVNEGEVRLVAKECDRVIRERGLEKVWTRIPGFDPEGPNGELTRVAEALK